MYVTSVNALIGGNLSFLELYLEVPSCQKLTQTEHQLAHQRREFMTSPVYVCTRMNMVATEIRGD